MEKYCKYCSNSFVNGINPDYDGVDITIGKSQKDITIFCSSAGLNKPAPVKIEVWKHYEEFKQNFLIGYFVPKYCPFCGRYLKENEKYFKELNYEKKNN